jgi:hypothetical protein
MTQIGEKVSVPFSSEEKLKSLKVKVTKVEFLDVFRCCLSKSEIKGHHWPAGEPAPSQSDKPAVWPFKKAGLKAKVSLDVWSENVSGDGKLIGNIDGLNFEGTFSLATGTPDVEVELQDPPTGMKWARGHMFWGVEGDDRSILAGVTNVELFFVLADPATRPFFTDNGVWVEALRFLFLFAKVRGLSDEAEATKAVTKCCFTLPTHHYDIDSGAAKFGGASGTFHLERYMKISAPKRKLNCYDQAYAVIVFSGALGIVVDGLFMKPFGYLRKMQLVGRGLCNNPFPQSLPKKDYLIVNGDDHLRQPFYNHMFCELSAKIYDACAGPATGTGDRAAYVKTSVDSKTPLNAGSIYPGNPNNIVSIAQMPGVSVTAVS